MAGAHEAAAEALARLNGDAVEPLAMARIGIAVRERGELLLELIQLGIRDESESAALKRKKRVST